MFGVARETAQTPLGHVGDVFQSFGTQGFMFQRPHTRTAIMFGVARATAQRHCLGMWVTFSKVLGRRDSCSGGPTPERRPCLVWLGGVQCLNNHGCLSLDKGTLGVQNSQDREKLLQMLSDGCQSTETHHRAPLTQQKNTWSSWW